MRYARAKVHRRRGIPMQRHIPGQSLDRLMVTGILTIFASLLVLALLIAAHAGSVRSADATAIASPMSR